MTRAKGSWGRILKGLRKTLATTPSYDNPPAGNGMTAGTGTAKSNPVHARARIENIALREISSELKERSREKPAC